MSDEEINQAVNDYIRENLSPKQNQRDYITTKYEELRGFLKNSCFQSGSYARYTANHPVHDLDVIHPVKDASIQHDQSLVMDALYAVLEEGYASSDTKIKSISRQTHSVTVEFADWPGGFSIDVVPAIELTDELNEFGDPIYRVPEILEMNKHNRQIRYGEANANMLWIKSDPRGYVKAAQVLNDSNSNFRHTAKLLKAWRHAFKIEYEDDFCLKSFHLEQVIFRYFSNNPDATTIDAAINCIGELVACLQEPQFPDRADPDIYTDEYINGLTSDQKQLILRLQAVAYSILRQLPGCGTEEEIKELIKKLLTITRTPSSFNTLPQVVTPRQPWGY